MCGRYALHTPRSAIAREYFGIVMPVGDVHARYNITPGVQVTLVAAPSAPGPVDLGFSTWGFRPEGVADPGAPTPINARAETVAGSRYFRHAFAHRRGLLPADGWFEWRTTERGKQPYYVTRRDEKPLFFAGVWAPTGEGTDSRCAIITEPAVPALQFIHPRMPVVLDAACFDAWLDPALTSREGIRAATRRLDPDALHAYPVSTRVNRPENNDPGLLEPLDPAELP